MTPENSDEQCEKILCAIVEKVKADLEKSYPEEQMMTDLLVYGSAAVKVSWDDFSGEVKFDQMHGNGD